MGCKKTLTMNAAAAPLGELPLHDAAYATAANKIFGTCGPYVLKFNAVTGAYESKVRIASGTYGYVRICYHAGTGMIFASGHNEINNQWFGVDHPGRDIYQIVPATMTVTRLNIGAWMADWEFDDGAVFGPGAIVPSGDYLYFQHEFTNGGFTWAAVKATDLITHLVSGGFSETTALYGVEQIAVSGGWVFLLDPGVEGLWADKDDGLDSGYWGDTTGYHPVGICGDAAAATIYMVCGDTNLLAMDDLLVGPPVAYDLSTAVGYPAGTTPVPVRVKLLSDGLLYMPCMAANGIIVWNPALGTGTFKSGFVNPVDVVETPTKKWAVQNSVTGLKEIT